jgi:hypothetical protein
MKRVLVETTFIIRSDFQQMIVLLGNHAQRHVATLIMSNWNMSLASPQSAPKRLHGRIEVD